MAIEIVSFPIQNGDVQSLCNKFPEGRFNHQEPMDQWQFQEPKLEMPTIYKAYVLGLCKGIYPQNMALHGTVPPF